MNNFLQAYHKVEAIAGFLDAYTAIMNTFNGINITQREVSLSKTGVSRKDIDLEEAIHSASYNIPKGMAIGTFGGWYQGYMSSRKGGNNISAVYIYMPLLDKGKLGVNRTIPTGFKVKFGAKKVPVKVKLGNPKSDEYGGSLVGFGIHMTSERELMRMDYHSWNEGHGGVNKRQKGEISAWRDGNYHYHVSKWD